jgi:hypothetical protein
MENDRKIDLPVQLIIAACLTSVLLVSWNCAKMEIYTSLRWQRKRNRQLRS